MSSNDVRVIQDAISISLGWDWTFLAMESRSCSEISELSFYADEETNFMGDVEENGH